jgi:hypothetical protein
MPRLALRDTLAVHLDGDALERAVRRVDAQRRAVQWMLAVVVVAVLVLELRLPDVVLRGASFALLLVPVVSVRVFGYLVAAWLLTQPMRYRFGFGLALGLGLVQATLRAYALATDSAVEGAPTAVALLVVHAVLAGLALRASLAYPAQSRRWPWVLGAASALLFVVLLPMAALTAMRASGAGEPLTRPVVPVIPLDARHAAETMAECARGARTPEGYPDAAAFAAVCRDARGELAVSDDAGAETLQRWTATYEPLRAADGTVGAFRVAIEVRVGEVVSRAFADTAGVISEVRLRTEAPPAAGRTPESR